MSSIRNFCIIAHIDHGKSTLADRLLDFTGAVSSREKQDQLLDNMDLERERGITIKSHAIQMNYSRNGQDYVLNLIDTPGHVDFSYEVSRSIAACEGALLVVDAAQSIQAQTISNLYLALENDLEIIPVLNKVDLPSANPEVVVDEIVSLIGCKADEVILASAKTGEGIEGILRGIVDRVPAPNGNPNSPLQALIFDSVFNPYRGIETYFKVVNGKLSKGDRVKFVSTGKDYGAEEVGTLKLSQVPKKEIKTGDVGYLITGIKEAKEVKLEPQKINTPKKTTKATVSRRDQRRLDKQAKREAKIAETRKKGKAALASGDKATANRLRRKQTRIEGRIAKTNKKMSGAAEDKSKVKTKVKSRRRAAKGSTRATLRK